MIWVHCKHLLDHIAELSISRTDDILEPLSMTHVPSTSVGEGIRCGELALGIEEG
jgi:hypothetical protein